jgi:DNA polymerase III subunit delta
MDFKTIIQEIKAKKPKPVYLLHGEEPYYIDAISQAAAEHLLEEHERDFNQTIFYGKDTDLMVLYGQLRQFPMMADYQVVILKEAQDVKSWEPLESYFENPIETTVFIICHKYKKADARKKYVKDIQKNGVIFESKKLYDNQVDPWIQSYLKNKGFTISTKASALLVEFLGNDLGRIAGELDKLGIILAKGTEINEVHVEENIGISKDYNAFELSNAVAKRDILKAHKIINYFDKNPKAAHITMILPLLFSFYERLLRAHFMGIKDAASAQSKLKLNYFVAQELIGALRVYNPKIVARNISLLHTYDLKSKGVARGPGSDADLLRELIYQLMH